MVIVRTPLWFWEEPSHWQLYPVNPVNFTRYWIWGHAYYILN
jgi:hypothetical protein